MAKVFSDSYGIKSSKILEFLLYTTVSLKSRRHTSVEQTIVYLA